MVRDVRGDVALVRGRSVNSFLIGEQYYVGTLHWWSVLWFHLAGHPVLMALGSLLGSIFIALGLYGALRRRAERRLATKA